jgi:glucose-6-phosphate isomerase
VHDVLAGLNPETTLVIVASKTFTTIETMTNAQTPGPGWRPSVADPAAQFAAVSTAADKTAAFGIDPASLGSRIGSAGAIRSGGRLACR